jgi:uncharacterized membrane protein YkvA (DUF1232 family)
MTSAPSRLPSALDRHLATPAAGEIIGIPSYVEKGAELVTPQAIKGLLGLWASLQRKLARVEEGSRLRRRLDVLARFVEEAQEGPGASGPALRASAFALLYFLKGADRIPDAVPEVGLLDDAMVVQAVLDNHCAALRAHWTRHQRVWPEEL